MNVPTCTSRSEVPDMHHRMNSVGLPVARHSQAKSIGAGRLVSSLATGAHKSGSCSEGAPSPGWLRHETSTTISIETAQRPKWPVGYTSGRYSERRRTSRTWAPHSSQVPGWKILTT